MPRLRYWLLAAVPVAAVWFYAVGQSAAALRALLADAATAAPPTVASSTPGADAAPPAARATLDSAPVRPPNAAPPAFDAAADRFVRDADPVALAPPATPATLPVHAAPTDLPHPEVTDPRLRALLQPAWDD